ncbi:hypothetical protein CERSUDRAFT_111052 [Gelatoporia subvermispora B]|uniref:DUF803-domain-containing protein n=1 Tax=Ceriporiopsis subvermispora (strain B) TaxID=914234 RepID=M2RNP3_CERS8|nr:hypothetical protein CERSUDRAFT_111052 [Gelatoporia subvermispora B]
MTSDMLRHTFPLAAMNSTDTIALPQITTATAAGIAIAISGNVLISLALNCQKLAHRRLEEAYEREDHDQAAENGAAGGAHKSAGRSRDAFEDADDEEISLQTSPRSASAPVTPTVAVPETEPLLPIAAAHDRDTTYGAASDTTIPFRPKTRRFFSFLPFERNRGRAHAADRTHLASTHALMIPVDVVPMHADRSQRHDPNSNENGHANDKSGTSERNESDYLKSKLWWCGFLLMNIGEMGNFISYAFAPASIVAPLGTFALIANCIFAPVMLKECFRKRDFFGIVVAIIGAVTVVLSTNPSDTQLDPEGLIKAVAQRAFLVYSTVYVVFACILSGLSEGNAGKRWVYVDVGMCALFGGFTVLSTKAFSTLLTRKGPEIFTEWITYPVIAILIGTGIGQIKYLNRALMRFDSKIVVPTQFVLFNLSAIVGSAILYRDFEKASFHQIVTFLYGCGATFAGVFIIAWAPALNTGPVQQQGGADLEDENALDHVASEIDTVDAGAFGSPRYGSIGRRGRAKLVVPDGVQASPILRNRRSTVSLYGLSPAQHLLLINTPPLDDFVRPGSQDPERNLISTPDSLRRTRAISWLGDEARGRSGQGSRRTPSVAGSRNTSRGRGEDAAPRSISRSPF